MRSSVSRFAVFAVAGLTAACGGLVDGPLVEGAYSDHDEASDFEPAPTFVGKGDDVAPIFDPEFIVSDTFFRNADAMTASEIQAFLDDTPYGNQSWLATQVIDGKPLSQVIAEVAERHSVHPLMILTRFQVEGSHIGRSSYPGSRSANRALGCGCFDGRECQQAYLGLDKQVDCAAATLEKRYVGSVDQSWEWQRGQGNTTLDGVRVVPANHATAALYAYTPWVLRGRGGNWLVWNVTKKFLAHSPDAGTVGATNPTNPDVPLWIGAPCVTDDDCGFSDHENFGFCYDFVDVSDGATRGFCTLVCEGFCPDRAGAPTTYCIEADVGGAGICASKSEDTNNYCADTPGTIAAEVERFVGSSAAPVGSETVCRPNDI